MNNIPTELEQISPRWYKRLTTENIKSLQNVDMSIRYKPLHITVSTCCITGEAYNFTRNYFDECYICANISRELSVAINSEQEQELVNSLVRFVKHFKEVHRR